MNITAEISIGELLDKITILEIKSERITDTEKLKNIHKEDRKSVVQGKSVDHGGRRIIKKKKKKRNKKTKKKQKTKQECERQKSATH